MTARICLIGLAVLALLSQRGYAQTQAGGPEFADAAAGIVPTVENGKRIYTAAQFARFAPQSAADLVQQIPGFQVSNVSDDRGIGEASQNVLINGQRITGKGTDAMTILRRTPVSAVRRMELVDGAMLAISGLAGHVVNVIVEQGSLQGNFVWRPQIRERIWDHWQAGEVNVSGKAGANASYALGLRWDGFRGGGWGGEVQSYPATGESYFRAQQPLFGNDIPRLSGSYQLTTTDGSLWNLNGAVDHNNFKRHIHTRYQAPTEQPTSEVSNGSDRSWHTELGSDYEFALGGGRLKLVGLYTQRSGTNINELTQLVDGASVASGSMFSRDSTQGERVLRGEYRWKAASADWSVSTEAAQNFVDADGALAALDNTGAFQPVALLGASSRVQELRGESVLSASRALRHSWSMQLSGGVEHSQLKQDGDNTRSRQFWRPKGSLSLAWNPHSAWETNLRLQRKVGQLDFYDFLASVDLQNNNANGSNSELVPPQSWQAQVEAIRNLGPSGKIRLTVEVERIQDLVDQIPISSAAEAPGNIPRARRLQVSLNTSLLLDSLGLRGGKLDSVINIRDTSVRDPLLGTQRHFNGNTWYWNVDFRHDVPGTPWAWGWFNELGSRSHSYRLDFTDATYQSRPFGSVFLEHKKVFGLKLRLEVANLYNAHDRAQRTSYVARRDGPIDYIRDYNLTFGRIYRLQLSGTF